MPTIGTDMLLHYDVGRFGELGYAVPAFGNDPGTNSKSIWYLIDFCGKNLFNLAHWEDTILTTPPSLNFLIEVDRLYKRVTAILAAKAVPENELELRTVHVQPHGSIFRFYPAPYYFMPNQWIRSWVEYAMIGMAEAIQHTENAKTIEITDRFEASIVKWFKRLYRDMSVEMFGKTREEADADGFRLTTEDFQSYSPSTWFTETELVDHVHDLGTILTEDEIAPLRRGIYATDLAGLKPFPSNVKEFYERRRRGEGGGAYRATGGEGLRDPNRPV